MNNAPWIIADRPINIGLVGCGRIADNHLQAIIEHHDNLRLTAICEPNVDILNTVCDKYGAELYDNIDDLLRHSNTDLIILCTPSGLHAAQTIKVAQSGRHVLTEKPMATRWQDAVNMVRACDAHRVRLFVIKQNRLNATMQLLKQAIDRGRFGKIYMANVNVFWTRLQEYYDQARWRGTWEFDGGAFMNQASHYVDLMHWLLGPIESVQAIMATLARNIQSEDSGVLNIRWRSGALGSMNVTMLTYPQNFEGSITILGERGTVRIGGVAVNEIQHWEFADLAAEDEQITAASYQTNSVYGFGHSIYYANLIKSLQGLAHPLVDGHEGLSSFEVLIAAYRAARDKKTVHLPLEL